MPQHRLFDAARFDGFRIDLEETPDGGYVISLWLHTGPTTLSLLASRHVPKDRDVCGLPDLMRTVAAAYMYGDPLQLGTVMVRAVDEHCPTLRSTPNGRVRSPNPPRSRRDMR